MNRHLRLALRWSLWSLTGAMLMAAIGLEIEDRLVPAHPLGLIPPTPAPKGPRRPPGGHAPIPGIDLMLTNQSRWPICLSMRCRVETERQGFETELIRPTHRVWIPPGREQPCTLPLASEGHDLSVMIFWSPPVHAWLGYLLDLPWLGERATDEWDLPAP